MSYDKSVALVGWGSLERNNSKQTKAPTDVEKTLILILSCFYSTSGLGGLGGL